MLWALASLPGRGFERRGRYLERSKWANGTTIASFWKKLRGFDARPSYFVEPH